MKRSLLFLLLMALFMPWAAQAQTRETLTFDFEDQTIPSTWTNDATYPWVVTNAAANAGTYSIKSGNSGVNNSTSTITATYTFAGDGSISFAVRCSSEQSNPSYDWDYGTFYIDNVQQGDKIINSSTFSTFIYDVQAGEHTFMWKYKKDGSVGSNDDCLYVDDVVVDLGVAGAISKPTGLAVSNVTDNSATLSWNENGTATAWQICLNNDETHLIGATENPYTLNNLNALTAYTVKVRSVDGSNTSSWSTELSFNTTAVAEAVGDAWSDNFEGSACGWELINGTLADAWVWGTATNNGGTHAIYISDNGGTAWNYSHNSVKVLAAKLLTFTEGKFTFSYDWNCYGESSYDFLRVALVPASQTLTAGSDYGTISTTSLPSGWIALDGGGKLNQVQTWQNKEVAVNVTAGNYYLVFAWRSDSSTQNQPPAAVDNVSITRVACPYDVTGLAVSEITSNSATLSWNVGEATQWQVAYGTDSNFEGATEEIVNTASYNMSGLQSSSIYYVKVRAYCGGEDFGTWCQAITFTTEVACPAPTNLTVTPTPISANVSWTSTNDNFELWWREKAEGASAADFEDGTLGDWTTIDADGDGYTWYVLKYSETEIPGHNESEGLATSASYLSVALTPDNYLVSPQITLGGSITFWACGQDAAWAGEHFGVAVSTNGNTAAADFTTIAEWDMTAKSMGAPTKDTRSGNRDQGAWYPYTVDLSAYSGQGYVAIRHFNCTDMFRLNVDDINVIEPGHVENEWTVVNPATNPYSITDLSEGTTYEVQVRSICGGEDGESAWVYTTFATPSNCDAPTALNVTNLMPTTATLNWTGYQDSYEVRYRPLATLGSYGFEDGTLQGWTNIIVNADGGQWLHSSNNLGNYDYTGVAHGGTGFAMCYSFVDNDGAYNTDAYLVSPNSYAIERGTTLKFWYDMANDDYPEYFEVCVATAATPTASDFTRIWALDNAKGNNGQKAAVRKRNTRYNNWQLVTIDLNDYAGQTIWIAFHDVNEDMYEIWIDDVTIEASASEDDWTMATIDATTIDIEDLSPETSYEWQVRGENRNCTNGEDEGYTAWSEMGTFTTPGDCDPLADLKIDELTATSITLSWTGYQESYNVQYRTAAIIDYYFEDWFEEGLSNWTEDNTSDYNYATQVTSSGIYGYLFFVDEEISGAQTIISTEMEPTTRGTLLDFYSASEGNSTYKIGFSSTDNALASFTWSEELTCVGDGYFHNYQGEVPEGTKYFAIQFVSNDNEEGYFIITGFEVSNIVAEAGEWITFEGVNSPYTINGLDSETEYEVYVQGVCSEGTTEWVGGNFTTPELTTITQTTELVKGWNWFSTYIEMNDVNGLDMLKESLGENGLVIRNSEVYTEYDGEWFGDLDDVPMTNEEMYMIETSEACTVTLTGMAADPANHPITINPGWNWIGFPYSQELPIEVALANFNAEEGDMFRNSEVYTEFDGEVWFGDVETLSPGQGFMYFSNSQTTKTVYYNTGSKANRSTNGTLTLKKHAINKHVIGSLIPIKKIK